MNSIPSQSESDQDQVQSSDQLDDTKEIKKSNHNQSITIQNNGVINMNNGDDQITSHDSLKLIQESKRSSFLISNTRKLQILKQMHLMSSEELYEVCLQILQKSPTERNHFDLQILQKTFCTIQFFQNFEEQSGQSALLNLYKHLELETYDIHDLVIQQGTRGDKFYIILQGSVGVFIKPAAPPPAPSPQLAGSVKNQNGQVNPSNKEIKYQSSHGHSSLTQSQLTVVQSNKVRNSPSSFQRQQSPTDLTKHNLSTQINNSQTKFDQQSIRIRNDSNDQQPINPSLNMQTFSQITSDTILQDQGQEQSQNEKNLTVLKQGVNILINQNNSTQNKPSIKNPAAINQNSKQPQAKANNTNGVQQNQNQFVQVNTLTSIRQKSEVSIPLQHFDDFGENSSQIAIENQNISQEKQQYDKKSNNAEKLTSSVTSSLQAKSAQMFADQQVYAFLNILQHKNVKERVIFPPHEQKNWQKVNQMIAGQSFGELALLNDAPRMANVVCNSVCHFAVLKKKDFREVVATVESQKIKGYIQFLQGAPGFDKISRRGLNMLVYSFEIKQFRFRDLIFKEKQKADYLYIVKDGEFCLQQSVDYQPPRDPTRYNYEEFNTKYKPANQNKAVRKVQIAVLSKGELFGDYEIFAEIPRCMEAVCTSQKGEVFCISFQNLVNRCEILNDRELLANLKLNSQAKHGIHAKMLKYFHGTSSSFQSMLVNNQKLIADQRNTDCINVNRSQIITKKKIVPTATTQQVSNQQQINHQTAQSTANQQLKESLYEPAFITTQKQSKSRGKSVPSSARQRHLVQNNNLEEREESEGVNFQPKQENIQYDVTHRSFSNTAYMNQRFSDSIQEFSSIPERNQILPSNKQTTKKGEIFNQNENVNYSLQNSQERMQVTRQVPRINMSFIKTNQTPSNNLNSSRPMSSERSNFASSFTGRSRFNNTFNQQDTPFIQIQQQSGNVSPKKKQADDTTMMKNLSKSFTLNKQSQRQNYSSRVEAPQLQQTKLNIDKSEENLTNTNTHQNESIASSTTIGLNGTIIPPTTTVRKRLIQPKIENEKYEKDLKSENMIKAKKMILNQLNHQAQRQYHKLNKSVDFQNNSSVVSVSQQVTVDTNKAVDQGFKPNLAFSKLQINPHVDYNETRKQVLRKMRKFKQIDYLNELKKTKQIDQDKLNNEYTKIHTIRNKGCIVINPHAFINFVNIS